MEDIEGFYKLDGEELLCAPNFVLAPTFELQKESKDSYDYPVGGWTWFDSLDAACVAFSLEISKYADTPEPIAATPRNGRSGS